MVLGTPTIGMPRSHNCWAMLSEPSPPMDTSAERPRASHAGLGRRRSIPVADCRLSPWPVLAENRPRLAVPRMVPPRVSRPPSV